MNSVNSVNPINRKPLLIIAIPILCLLGSIPVSSLAQRQVATVRTGLSEFASKTENAEQVDSSETSYQAELRAHQTLARLTTRAQKENGHVTITSAELKDLAHDMRTICRK